MKIDVQLEQDSYIRRGKVLSVKTGNMKSTFVISFRKTIHHMMEMRVFWQMRLRKLKNYGTMFRSCRKKSEKKAVFWSVKQRLFPV